LRAADPAVPLTELLQSWSRGDREAEAEVLPLVYGELHRLAAGQIRREPAEHTLEATALVHEAYLRLARTPGLRWESRAHFLAFAARLLRRILVDHARQRKRLKRGGRDQRITLAEAAEILPSRAPDLIALDEALASLASRDRRKADVVELRFFGGLTLEETAALLGVSPDTVHREWRRAKAWLYHALTPTDGRPPRA
jgi:RNA polymerase sigma factor (TIGR02999 family)